MLENEPLLEFAPWEVDSVFKPAILLAWLCNTNEPQTPWLTDGSPVHDLTLAKRYQTKH
jgi:hypothetical protein